MTADMTFRAMNLAVFERKPTPHVLFQPRFEPWWAWCRQFGGLPAELEGLTQPQVYRHVGCGQRYVDYATGNPSPVEWVFDARVPVTETGSAEAGSKTFVYHTPHGDLTEVKEFTVDRTWRTVRFPANGVEDLDALRWLVARRRINFKPDAFKAGAAWMGDRGEPQFYIIKSPYMALAQQYMRYEAFIYALVDAPKQVADVMRAIDDSYDGLFEQLAGSEVRIVNFGENLTHAHASPALYEEHLLPWYTKRSNQLRDAGLFTHIHIDGHFRGLLPYLADMPFDGLEALTPQPQGDVSLDELIAHLGDKVLLDGIPAVLFLDHHPFEALRACCERLVAGVPNLVLGISDELPQAAGEEGYRRLKWVADWAKTQTPAAPG